MPLTIESGSSITVNLPACSNNNVWEYVPFNMNLHNPLPKLVAELEEQIDKKVPHYKDMSQEDKNAAFCYFIQSPANIRGIRSVYNKIFRGELNENGLVLFSFPHNNCSMRVFSCGKRCQHFRYHMQDCYLPHHPGVCGCFFTGDSDSNIIPDIVYNKYKARIGTIQIPHHGSIKNFSQKILLDNSISVISYGTNNRYGHPSSQVLSELLSKTWCCHQVTEKHDSTFIEIFDI